MPRRPQSPARRTVSRNEPPSIQSSQRWCRRRSRPRSTIHRRSQHRFPWRCTTSPPLMVTPGARTTTSPFWMPVTSPPTVTAELGYSCARPPAATNPVAARPSASAAPVAHHSLDHVEWSPSLCPSQQMVPHLSADARAKSRLGEPLVLKPGQFDFSACACSGLPQFGQNREPAGTAAWQCGHSTVPACSRRAGSANVSRMDVASA